MTWCPHANQVNANFGFYAEYGRFHEVNFPTSHNFAPPVNHLLGVNDSGIAVGFYTDNSGNNHGYEFNIFTHRFTRVTIPGATSGIPDGAVAAGAAPSRFLPDG